MATEAARLGAIREKVEAGERLSFDDGLALEGSDDLFSLGRMANLVRERANGNYGYYNVNTHINPTNVCVYKCDFCAFRADLNDPRAYVMDRAQILARAKSAHDRGARRSRANARHRTERACQPRRPRGLRARDPQAPGRPWRDLRAP